VGAQPLAEITAGKPPAKGCSVQDVVAATFSWPPPAVTHSKQLSNKEEQWR